MKRFMLPLLAVAIALVACSKEEDTRPSVSFETAIPTTVDGASVLSITVKDYTGSDPVTIPVTFSGTAEKDVDYAVSAEAFVYGGASPVTTIKITPINYDSQKSVTVTIEIPDGFIAGQYTVSTFSLSEKIGYCSFIGNSAIMTSRVKISAGIYNGNGSPLKLQSGDEIPVTINTEKSTAAEGVNFKFADDKRAITIAPASSEGSVTLELVGEVNPYADKIVLSLNPSGKYGLGQTIEVEISIIGSAWEKLGGTWVINELVTDKTYMDETWSWAYESDNPLDGFPEFNGSDKITFDIEGCKFIPDFKSEFKNYFIGESTILAGDEFLLRTGMGGAGITLQLFELDNVNRYFSETELSEDKAAFVGARFGTLEEDGEDNILHLYIIDYISKSFLQVEFGDWMYNTEKPTATTSGMYIEATFKKAE